MVFVGRECSSSECPMILSIASFNVLLISQTHSPEDVQRKSMEKVIFAALSVELSGILLADIPSTNSVLVAKSSDPPSKKATADDGSHGSFSMCSGPRAREVFCSRRCLSPMLRSDNWKPRSSTPQPPTAMDGRLAVKSSVPG